VHFTDEISKQNKISSQISSINLKGDLFSARNKNSVYIKFLCASREHENERGENVALLKKKFNKDEKEGENKEITKHKQQNIKTKKRENVYF
jgi:hypothetical protein